MQIQIHDPDKRLSATAIQKTESRLVASFSKFGEYVKRIDLPVSDANGPRGGVDQQCRIGVQLKRMEDVNVVLVDESLSTSLSRAVKRAERAVDRRVQRKYQRDYGRASELFR